MADYCKAFNFYCRLSPAYINRILFIENSSSDLSPLQEIAHRTGAMSRTEFLSFNGLDHSPRYGRGYGEFKLLDYAMQSSSTLSSASGHERLWKVTGRYRVLNLPSLIRTAPKTYDLYADMRDQPMPWVDLRVFSVTVDGYRKLLQGIYPQLREHWIQMAPERYLRPILGELAATHPIVTRFRREPFVDGLRGWDSKNYSTGNNLLKYCVRAFRRRVDNLLEARGISRSGIAGGALADSPVLDEAEVSHG